MTGRTRIGIIAAIVVLGILGYGYLSDSSGTLMADEQSKKGDKEGERQEPKKFEAPDFTLKNLDGKEVSLSDYEGKIVFINFWATWCGPCRHEVPAFVELQEEYGKDTLVILGISLDRGDLSVVPKFAEDYEINYEVLYGDATVVQKYGGVTSIPTTFIVDRNGYIRDGMRGFPGKDYFVQAIKNLM